MSHRSIAHYIIFVDEETGREVDSPVELDRPMLGDLWRDPAGAEWEVVPGPRRSFRKVMVPGLPPSVVTEVPVSAVGEKAEQRPAPDNGSPKQKRQRTAGTDRK